MHVVIFEGSRWTTFAPLALSRPVFMLATGATTLLDKQLRHLAPTRLTLWVRPELEEHCRLRVVPRMAVPTSVNTPLDEEPALLCSGRAYHLRRFQPPDQEAVVLDEDHWVRLAWVKRPGLSHADVWGRTRQWMDLLALPEMPAPAHGRMAESPWDLVKWNEESLVEDWAHLRDKSTAKPPGPYHMVNEQDISLGAEVRLSPGCVLDASRGPIIVGEKVLIGANSIIEGPCYLGAYSFIRPLSYIRPGTSIGMMCKIGGEVQNTIVLGWSHKAHDGYLGDSYIGKWVNLGAGTTTSNLKNTYGEVRVRLGGRETPIGHRFLGSIIGDHTKTAILTRLGCGSYMGFCGMIATSATAPKFVPSFTFLTDRGAEPYQLDKAIEVTRRVFARRDRPWTDFDERIMRYVAAAAPAAEGGV